MMNIYRNRFSYDFDSEGNVVDAIVGFSGMDNDGESTMANIKVAKEDLTEDKTFDEMGINDITKLAKGKWLKFITGDEAKQDE